MIEECKDLRGSVRPRRTSDIIVKDPLIPLPTPNHDPFELLKATSNVVVAAERALKGPEDLTDETTAQIGLYTPSSGRPLAADQGANLLPTVPSWFLSAALRDGVAAE